MLTPVTARGDRGTADEVATSLATLRMDREIDPNPAKLSDFGLDPPAAEVTIEVKGRSEPLRAVRGQQEPDRGLGLRARGRRSRPCSLSPRSSLATRAGPRPTSGTRPCSPSTGKSVTGVELDVDGQRIAPRRRRSGGKWRIAQPGPYRADADVVTELLDRLASAPGEGVRGRGGEGARRVRARPAVGGHPGRSAATRTAPRRACSSAAPTPRRRASTSCGRESRAVMLVPAEVLGRGARDGRGAPRQDRGRLRLRQGEPDRDR